ncbi:MAG TPA: class I SAM-dependent methyltransferase [Candidatus Nitrosopolaris sp.]|nr:class I SAM-dependent methyltransferase [Candidatus Nitrosopolaris sp.]
MFYELKITIKTLRKEGVKPLLIKIFLYFRQLLCAFRFLVTRMPHGAQPAEVVDFSFNTPGRLIYPGQVRSEILQLAELVRQRKPRGVVEIGTANGGTLSIWCALADPKAVIISIDLPGGIHGGGYPYWKTLVYRHFAQPEQSLHLLRADSHQPGTRDNLKAILPLEGIDFLFIDGDHTYDGVKTDFELYSALVRPGGLVVLHDICAHPPEMDCHVDQFWSEIRSRYKTWEYIENPHSGGFGIGVVEI